jgi:ornithine cyclodeaminase/alanine dehydrogenase-like protein (mu-crystallin family)
LSKADIEKIDLAMSDTIAIVEEVFRQKGNGYFQMPPKPEINPSPETFIHAMPACLPKMHSAGIKWAGAFSENYRRRLPTLSALIILNDPGTGVPIAVMDGAWITAKRTGAATAVAAKYLARTDSRVLGIIGCGVEGRSNLEALYETFDDLEEVRAYDILPANQLLYVNEMTEKFGLTIKPARGPREAVDGCDVIVTATHVTKNPDPTIESAWIKNGSFACPLDHDSCWKPEAMHSMHKFCTDDTEQFLYYRSMGYFKDVPTVYADLGQIVVGTRKGRESEQERIMSMNLGLAIEDMPVALKVYETAKQRGIGERLEP